MNLIRFLFNFFSLSPVLTREKMSHETKKVDTKKSIFAIPNRALALPNYSKLACRLMEIAYMCRDYQNKIAQLASASISLLHPPSLSVCKSPSPPSSNSFCALYPGCSSYVLFYLEDSPFDLDPAHPNTTTEEQLEKISKSHLPQITSLLIAVEFPGMLEIYDVCTVPVKRGKKHMSSILDFLIAHASQPSIWLGVRIDNPMFDLVVKIYARHHFQSPQLQNKTPHLPTPLSFDIIGMTYSASLPVSSPEQVIEMCKKIKQGYKSCSLPIHIHQNVLEPLRRGLLFLEYETTGSFVKDKTITIQNKDRPSQTKSVSNLIVNNVLLVGSRSESVSLPLFDRYMITFHTHPISCYQEQKVCVGWASGEDLVHIMYAYPSLKKHYVWTQEGMYSLQLSPSFQRMYASLSPAGIKAIADVVKLQFQLTHPFRAIEFQEMSQQEPIVIIGRWITFCNSYTYSKLFESIVTPEPLRRPTPTEFEQYEQLVQVVRKTCPAPSSLFDIPLFIARIFPWDDIRLHDGILESIELGSECLSLPNLLPGEKGRGETIPDTLVVPNEIYMLL